MALRRALATMSIVISTPITWPLEPSSRAARKQSKPAPLPKSRTVSPPRNAAADNGVPQPRSRSAPSGTAASSSSEYPTNVAESPRPSELLLPEQQEAGLSRAQQVPESA